MNKPYVQYRCGCGGVVTLDEDQDDMTKSVVCPHCESVMRPVMESPNEAPSDPNAVWQGITRKEIETIMSYAKTVNKENSMGNWIPVPCNTAVDLCNLALLGMDVQLGKHSIPTMKIQSTEPTDTKCTDPA